MSQRNHLHPSNIVRNTLTILCSLLLLGVSAQGQNASFYKEPQFFPTAPDPNKSVETIPRFNPFGNIGPGYPAEATSAFKKGLIIEPINGQKLKAIARACNSVEPSRPPKPARAS